MSDPNPQSGDPRVAWEHLYAGGPWHDLRKKTTSMRIGDTERAEIAEVLGTHYSDGRLDDQEFRERMDQAMSAKTRGDLDCSLWLWCSQDSCSRRRSRGGTCRCMSRGCSSRSWHSCCCTAATGIAAVGVTRPDPDRRLRCD